MSDYIGVPFIGEALQNALSGLTEVFFLRSFFKETIELSSPINIELESHFTESITLSSILW